MPDSILTIFIFFCNDSSFSFALQHSSSSERSLAADFGSTPLIVLLVRLWLRRAMARTKTATGTGRRRGGAGAVAKTKVSPAVRFADMRANAGQRFSIAGAKMSEKMTYLRANVMLKLHRLQHPSNPVKRVAATESIRNMKAAATERRRQKVARAVDNAARKRAQVRERRAIAMARHT